MRPAPSSTLPRRSAGAIAAVVIAVLALVAAGPAGAQTASRRTTTSRPGGAKTAASRPAPLRVLFVGNSYTYVNDLPAVLAALADAPQAPRGISVQSVVEGGATLEKHWFDGMAVRGIKGATWDIVVLQEQSARPFADQAKFLEYGRKFGTLIAAQKARTACFCTWSRANDPARQRELTTAYEALAKDTSGLFIPVGAAWATALAVAPARTLHQADQSHPTPAGTYLAACVFYATLLERDPTGLPAAVAAGGKPLLTLPTADARALQAAAWTTVRPRLTASARNAESRATSRTAVPR